MKRFINSIRLSLESANWYSALTTALTLPDVCGRLDTPNEGVGQRYKRWFSEWMLHNYKHEVGADREEVTFLSGSDCYALRCSYLHEGGSDITQQNAREALSNFHFITPPPKGSVVHCNKFDDALQLQVDIFCNEMADAADRWFESVQGDEKIMSRIEALLLIHDSKNGIAF